MAMTRSAAVRTPGELVRSIFLAGLLIAVLSSLDQVLYFMLVEHRNPAFDFQYIASALLGQAAFNGNLSAPLLGALLHVCVSLVVAAVFILASTVLGFLRRAPIVFSLLYGLAVFVVMNIVLVPRTLAPQIAVSLGLALNTLLGIILCVGLPCGLIVRQMAKGK